MSDGGSSGKDVGSSRDSSNSAGSSRSLSLASRNSASSSKGQIDAQTRKEMLARLKNKIEESGRIIGRRSGGKDWRPSGEQVGQEPRTTSPEESPRTSEEVRHHEKPAKVRVKVGQEEFLTHPEVDQKTPTFLHPPHFPEDTFKSSRIRHSYFPPPDSDDSAESDADAHLGDAQEHLLISDEFQPKLNNADSSNDHEEEVPSVCSKFLRSLASKFDRILEAITGPSENNNRTSPGEAEKVDSVDEIKTEISSDEEVDNLTAEEEELDNEWLDLENDLPGGAKQKSSRKSTLLFGAKRKSLFEYPSRYLDAMTPVYTALLLLGRFPIKIDRLPNGHPEFHFLRSCWRYRVFYGTSVFFVLSSFLMISSFFTFGSFMEPYTLHESLLILEHQKYWLEGILELLNTLFVAVCSIAMLEYGSGYFLTDFFNRWASSMSLLHYDVTGGLLPMIATFFLLHGLYVATFLLLFFFGGEACPSVRGACGFTGLLHFNSFCPELRLRKGYHWVEIFGLIAHLYTTLVSGLILLLVATHCWALRNAANRFNHRLAACLHTVEFNESPASPEGRKTSAPGAPYKKLFAEHLVVTSFVRQIGRIFSIALIAYLSVKLVELVLTVYALVVPIANGFSESDDKYFDLSKNFSIYNTNDTVPVLILEPNHIHFLKHVFFACRGWLAWFIFMEIVQAPGNSILRGAALVVRHHYIQCKTSHALRFIASMKFSYSERLVFHVNPGGIQLTRSCMAIFVGFAVGLTLTLLQFMPTQTDVADVVICDHVGFCTVFSFPPKVKAISSFANTIGPEIAAVNRERDTPKLPKTPRPNYDALFEFHFPPCKAEGRLPADVGDRKGFEHFAYRCYRSEPPVFIPTYFKVKDKVWHVQVPPDKSLQCEGICEGNVPFPEVDENLVDLVDCFGDAVDKKETDECGNPFIRTPDSTNAIMKAYPKVSVVKFDNADVFCCFVYSGLEGQGHKCNLKSLGTQEDSSRRCTRSSLFEGRNDFEIKISNLWTNPSEATKDKWTKCLCQGIGNVEASTTACENIEEPQPPGSPDTTTSASAVTVPTTQPSTPIGTCEVDGWTKNLCKGCEDPRSLFFTRYVRYCSDPEGPEKGRLVLPDVLHELTTKDQVTITLANDRCTDYLDTNKHRYLREIYDCYGHKFDVYDPSKRDDCGKFPQSFPSRRNGMEVVPTAKMEEIGNPAAGVFLFVCCWDWGEWRDAQTHSVCDLPPNVLTTVCSVRDAASEKIAREFCFYELFLDGHRNQRYRDRCYRDLCVNPPLEFSKLPRYKHRERMSFPDIPCPSLTSSVATFESKMLTSCPNGMSLFAYLDVNGKITQQQSCTSAMEVSLRSGKPVYDCYGFKYDVDELLDDCGHPGLLTPSRQLHDDKIDITQPDVPQLITELYLSSGVFTCCWKYASQLRSSGCNILGSNVCAFRTVPSGFTDSPGARQELCSESKVFNAKGINEHYIKNCPLAKTCKYP